MELKTIEWHKYMQMCTCKNGLMNFITLNIVVILSYVSIEIYGCDINTLTADN